MAPPDYALISTLFVLAGCTAQNSSNTNVAAGAGSGLSCQAATAPVQLQHCIAQHGQLNDREAQLACLPFSQPAHIKGVWVIALENSSFFEGAASFSPGMLQTIETWLEPDQWRPEHARSAQGERVRAYVVEFVGRRSLCRGGFGSMGVYPHEVLADRFTSIREVY
jgi:hypothetical protein